MQTDRSLNLRPAHRSEAAQLATMSRLQIEHGLSWRWTTARIRKQIKDTDSTVLVASIDGVIAGFSIMQFEDSQARLFLLAVEPKARRNGIGSALVRSLEQACISAGVPSIRLEVRASNSAAIEFYTRLGYRECDEIKAYYSGDESAIVMTRSPDRSGRTGQNAR